MGSSQTRARTRVPFIGRRILNHYATREVPHLAFIYRIKMSPEVGLRLSKQLRDEKSYSYSTTMMRFRVVLLRKSSQGGKWTDVDPRVQASS